LLVVVLQPKTVFQLTGEVSARQLRDLGRFNKRSTGSAESGMSALEFQLLHYLGQVLYLQDAHAHCNGHSELLALSY
jgi:hypothetical protein